MALGPGSHSRLRLACHCDSRALAWPGHVTGDRLCGFATVLWRVPGERSETRASAARPGTHMWTAPGLQELFSVRIGSLAIICPAC